MKSYLSLGDAIQSFLEKNGIQEEASIQEVIAEWESFMGKPIAQNTDKIWFKRNTLYIRMNSPMWRNELQLARNKIMQMVNTRLKQELVKEVRIV